MLSDSVLIFIAGTAGTLLGLTIKSIQASRCKLIKCGKCCEMVRDTQLEVNLDAVGTTSNNHNNSNNLNIV
jgi:hypothetical protein